MYSKIEPYKTEFLQVSELHTLYVEESGNSQGVPVLVLHGGPGAGTSPVQRQFFDPQFYRIILFDQRGAGRSTPSGETRENTTADLIADVEKIRKHLKIEKWLIFGGSWGSSLAMAYGVSHPNVCLGFILRGVFLLQEAELEWFLKGVHQFYPELWYPLMAKLLNAANVKKAYASLTYLDILELIDKVLHSKDEKKIEEILVALGQFEQDILTLMPEQGLQVTIEHCRNIAKIEHQYFINNRAEFAGMLEKLKRVQHLPCIIVQGRYDMVCPPVTAYQVHQAWPGSKLVMVPDGGHSAMDPAMTRALVETVDQIKSLLPRDSIDLE